MSAINDSSEAAHRAGCSLVSRENPSTRGLRAPKPYGNASVTSFSATPCTLRPRSSAMSNSLMRWLSVLFVSATLVVLSCSLRHEPPQGSHSKPLHEDCDFGAVLMTTGRVVPDVNPINGPAAPYENPNDYFFSWVTSRTSL